MATNLRTATSTWTVDKAHSNVAFEVKHLMIATVRGQFRDFEAVLHLDKERPENSAVRAEIDVASIDTNVADRDAHLRSDDFFNADAFPKIVFQSRRVETKDNKKFRLIGDLTIRDVTREVTLEGKLEGRIQDPYWNERVAFSAHTEISRQDFNVRWNQLLETGGVAVSDKVKIDLYIEAIKQAG